MEIGEIYQVILIFVLVGFLLGAGFVGLGAFANASGIDATSKSAINATITVIKALPDTYLSIILIIAVMSIIITLVVRAFVLHRTR